MSGFLEDAPYERLLALAICELELGRAGRLDALASCQEAKQSLMASLPAVPPPDARPALERCLAIERQLEIELRTARESVLEALSSLRQAQRAAAGYTPVRRRVRAVSADA
jgi:hypothetical protein